MQPRIHFREEGHIYWEEFSGRHYKSVTTFKKQFVPEFPREFMSLYKALEALEGNKYTERFMAYKSVIAEYGWEKGMKLLVTRNNKYSEAVIRAKQAEILAEWEQKKKDGLANGTKWHNSQERKALITQRVLEGTRYLKLSDYYIDNPLERPRLNYNLPDGAYVELLMANHDLQLAGQCDRMVIETIDGIRYIDIDDWKTDKKLDKDNPFESPTQFFLPPLGHIPNCNFNEYIIQIGLYAWIAESYGFRARKLSVTHVRDAINEHRIPYWKKDIEKILEYRKRELILGS